MTKKLLLSTVAWCPAHMHHRADAFEKHLDSMISSIEAAGSPETDFLIVDNDTAHPRVLDAIDKVRSLPYVTVERFSPQLGWGGGRNRAVAAFLNADHDILVMIDDDVVVHDLDWLQRIAALSESAPAMHAYMVRFDKYQILNTGRLPNGVTVDLYGEWLGMINVMDRTAVQTTGGYRTKGFCEWGFNDCEQGRRLKTAGVLAHGLYIDPIRAKGEHLGTVEHEPETEQRRNEIIPAYIHEFRMREQLIQKKQVPMYVDPSTGI